jgi:hypothetical protein
MVCSYPRVTPTFTRQFIPHKKNFMTQSTPRTVGELSLSNLLSSLDLILDPENYVFLTLPPQTAPPPGLVIQMLFKEREGLTAITTKDSAAKHHLSYTFSCRMITLNVHSSLEAVGFIAAIAEKLTQLKIGINPVSGYFHDHIFVPEGREDAVVAALLELKQEALSSL